MTRKGKVNPSSNIQKLSNFEKDFDQDNAKPFASENSYRILSSYIQKPTTLYICYLDYSPEALQHEDPTLLAIQLLPHLSHYPV